MIGSRFNSFVFLLVVSTVEIFNPAIACPAGCQCFSDAPFLASCIDKNLTEVPSDIPANTKELYLKGNRIRVLREAAFSDFISLERLVFTYNELESLESNAFVGLTELIHLDLRWNRLTSLPENGFSGLPSLRRLDLDFNNIKTIAEQAFKDLNLTKLGLEENPKLVEIHPDAFQDSHISSMFIFGSNISSQSADAFRYLRSSLHEFYWLNNQQSVFLPIDLFEGFKFIKLNLGNNSIKAKSFLRFVMTDDLSLSGNPVGTIDFREYPLLHSVRSLHLDSTNISHLDAAYFHGLKQLEILHIEDNRITTLPQNLKPVFSRLRSLKVDGNPFHCNCEMIWFKNWLTTIDSNIIDVSPVNCVTPIEDDITAVNDDIMQCIPPRVINITNHVTVRDGSQMTITCFAEGDPSPQIHWELPDGRIRSYSPAYNRSETVIKKEYQKIAKLSEAGNYRCVAVNLLGNDSSVATVKVLQSLTSSSPSALSSLVNERLRTFIFYILLLPFVMAYFS